MNQSLFRSPNFIGLLRRMTGAAFGTGFSLGHKYPDISLNI